MCCAKFQTVTDINQIHLPLYDVPNIVVGVPFLRATNSLFSNLLGSMILQILQLNFIDLLLSAL